MKKSLMIALGLIALGAPLASQAQALDAFSNPPPRVFVDPLPSAADPYYPGEEVAAPRHGMAMGHKGVIARNELGQVQPGYMPRYNAGAYDVEDRVYAGH